MSPSPAPNEGESSSAAVLSSEAIHNQVERIVSSAGFGRAERIRRFLRYIVEHRINGSGEALKEFAIGVAVFDRDENYDPRLDPIVRVEASRLRTKLREYYEGEGRGDAIRIELARGSYLPVITAQASPKLVELPAPESAPVQPRRVPVAWIAFGVVHVWAVAAQLALFRTRAYASPEPFQPVWHSFLSPEATNNVVFGSPLFFMDPTTSYFHRFVHLNDAHNLQNNSALAEMQRRFGTLIGPRYDYAELGDALVLQRVTAFLGRFGVEPRAIPAHEASWEGIREGNILFIGSDRMVPLLSHLPGKREFTFDGNYDVINRSPKPGEPALFDTKIGSVLYALVTKMPGLRQGRDILVLTSHSSPGTIAAADYLTRPETVRELSTRMGLASDGGQGFELVLRVYVDKGAAVKTEYVTHRTSVR